MSWFHSPDEDDYYMQMKVYTRPSIWGIFYSRISKLFIWRKDIETGIKGELIFEYDRGTDWEITPEIKKLVDELIEDFPGQLDLADEEE